MIATMTQPTAIPTDAMLLADGWLNRISDRLIATLREDGIENPLAEPVTLAAVLFDLYTLAGAPVPTEIEQHVG